MSAFFVENFGCRATQADGAALERQLVERGFARAASEEKADIVILNTCTVTSAADQDARTRIRQIHRQNPGCRILVTGCYAQRAPQEVAAIPGVEWVIGNSHKHRVGDVLTENFVPLHELGPGTDARVLVGDIFAHTELTAAPVFGAAGERTRPNLKVQDGCDNRCSFCVIPSVRGQSRSLKLDEVLRQVDALVMAGYRELVISGINLGRWGRDLPASGAGSATRFIDLVRAILERTALEKLRISSVEPMDWSDELISLLATSSRIAKHAHVPMQSGSDRILRRMNRKYRPWHYAEKIRAIRQATHLAAIGADVMVGFPGETEADFLETRRMIEELPFTYLHVFTYSARPGTRAASMPDHVPVRIAAERSRILRSIAAGKKREFMGSFLGRDLPVITLGSQRPDWTETLTDNYLKLRLAGQHAPNQWLTAAVQSVSAETLLGTTLD